MARASDVLDIVRGELGYTEFPQGSNKTKYGRWYGLDGNPWCMMFVQWCCAQAGVKLPARTASCGAMMRAAQDAGCWVTGDYKPGDVVIYDFPGGAATDHTGIVESVTASGIIAIEGNTGAGNDANGGQVQRRTRSNSLIVGAVRPTYDEEEEDMVTYAKLKDVPEKFRHIIDKLMTAGIVQGDGSDPSGNGDIINLTHEQVRTLVFIYRGGGFDRKLEVEGMETAVQ
ncbi:CHAP domain-containing protein [uncultured Oscillibacter sp.]|uniref:CHAP domain-containing protein n=1 Tax=uncultured Oscillibacter sp. TaxID=876091 RepID=UPI0025FF45EB|nr:CHAP domain-containing protein [uncultured Oscillibacter sp.]